MSKIFYAGDFPYISFTIMVLIALVLIFAAFKAPKRVKTIGLIALAYPVTLVLYHLYELCILYEMSGSTDVVSITVLAGGIKTLLFIMFCGFVVYLASLLISLVLNTDKK